MDLELRAHLEQLELLSRVTGSIACLARGLELVYADVLKALLPLLHFLDFVAASLQGCARTYAFGVDDFPVAFIPDIRALSPTPTHQLCSSRVEGATTPLCLRTSEHLISCTQHMA